MMLIEMKRGETTMAESSNVSVISVNGFRQKKYINEQKSDHKITCDYCGSEYSLNYYMEDKNICPDCNIYYQVTEEVYENLCTAQYDIMSLYVHLKKANSLTEPSKLILQKIYQSLYSMKRDISTRRGK
jgi:hypothetical protein